MTVTHEDILKTAIPTATVNFPGGGACRPRHTGVIISTLTRTRLAQRGLLYGVKEIENPTDYEKAHQLDHLIGEFAPELWKRDLIWASVSHNERVDKGAAGQLYRTLSTGLTTSPTFTPATSTIGFRIIALSTTNPAAAASHLSLYTTTASNQSLEYSTNGLGGSPRQLTGLSIGTYTNAGAAANETASAQLSIAFTCSGGTQTVYGAGIFDSETVTGSNLYAEGTFAEGPTSVTTADVLTVTWTVTM